MEYALTPGSALYAWWCASCRIPDPGANSPLRCQLLVPS